MKGFVTYRSFRCVAALVGMLVSIYATGQPSNDACASATVLTPNGTCVNGTTAGANDSWIGTVGCQTGNNNSNHQDVWYSFVSTGSQAVITVTAGTFVGPVELVLVSGSCAGLLTNEGSQCGNSPLTATFNGLTAGTTYFYTISGPPSGTPGTFQTCVTTQNPPVLSGQDCSTGAVLCNNNTFTQGASSSGFGTQELAGNTCLGTNERQSKWFKFTAGCSGTFGFIINPNVVTDDYDFALFNTTSGCPTTTSTALACNYVGNLSGSNGCTGINSGGYFASGVIPCALDQANPGYQPLAFFNQVTANYNGLNLVTGQSYALLIDNFTTSNSGFTLTFNGTATLGPNANFTATAGTCGAYSFTKTCAISPTTNSTYLWTFGDGNSSTAYNPTHTYSTSGTYLVSLVVTDALGCTDTYSQSITVNNAPLSLSSANPNYTGCINSVAGSIVYTITGTFAGYAVTGLPSGMTSTIAGSTITISGTPTSAGTFNYTVSTSGGCAPGAAFGTITILPNITPTFAAIGPLCAGTNFSLSNISQNGVSGTWSPAVNTTSSATYTFTPSPGQCASSTVLNVTVNSIPVVSYSGSTTLCSGNTTNIALSSTVSGTTFSWTVAQSLASGGSANSGSNISQTLNATSSTAGTVTYTVTPTASGCPGAAITIPVTVNPTPTVSFTGATTICSGNSTALNLTSNVSGATFGWLVNSTNAIGASIGTGSSIAQTLNATTAAAGTVVYTVAPLAASCPGNPISITVSVNPTPVASFTGPTTLCSGNATAISLSSNVSSTTFNWTVVQTGVSGGAASSGTGIVQTLSTTSGISGTATYSVTPTASTCVGAPLVFTITVNPTPSGAFTGPTTICSGATTALNLTSAVAGTTFTWTANATGVSGSSDSAGNSIAQTLTTTAAASGTVTYIVQPTANSCPGNSFSINILVNPVPNVTTTGATTICSSTSTSISLSSAVGGTTFAWTASGTGATGSSNGSGFSINQLLNAPGPTSNGTVTYTVTPTAGTCQGTPQLITITVVPVPVAPLISPTPLCAGASVNINATNGGPIYAFYLNGILQGSAAAVSTFNFSPLNAGDQVCIRSYANATGVTRGCYTQSCSTANALRTPNFSDPTICIGASVPLTNTSPNGITGTWSPAFSNTVSGTYTFTPTAGQCGVPQVVNITVLPPTSSTPINHN